ncbi:MAG: hypothetical protein RLY31_2307 [Bacteroidota bacterium]|jgi:ABC-2 type transport system permease protein
MNKLWLIIEREYMTRVKKKSFILTTLLSPLVFVAIMTVPVLLATLSEREEKSIAILDASGTIRPPADSNSHLHFTVIRDQHLDVLKMTYRDGGFEGILYVPPFPDTVRNLRVQYFSDGELSLSEADYMEGLVRNQAEDFKILAAGYQEAELARLKVRVDLEQKELTLAESGELLETDKRNSAQVATVIGFAAGFIVYIILLFYGTMIMRSVMEEKTNRIVEVMISSVRPFQLMLGKIIGVSGVGLTQMLIWVALTLALTTLAGTFLGVEAATGGPMSADPAPADQSAALFTMLTGQEWDYIIPLFLLYFLGGYFIYASLFAAVGSAMGDDLGESQSLTMVAMAPIILSIVMLGPVIEDPNGTLAVWFSIVPLSAPVIMPARLAFEPPLWEILLSLGLLSASSLFFIWLSGRIYRVGILLYGKKANLKEMSRWIFTKD